MSALHEVLQSLRPEIEQILSMTGSVGASIGILHDGETYTDGFGYRDHDLSIVPDGNTLYNIGSLTKSMIAATVGALVADGKIKWSTPISDIVTEFKMPDQSISDQSTFVDVLSHRSGLPSANVLWYQGESKNLLEQPDLLPVVNSMTSKFSIRDGYNYSNWGYALAGEAIQRVTNKPWQVVLYERVLDPLGMRRTRSDAAWKTDSNTADAFIGMNTARPIPTEPQDMNDSTLMGAAGGVCSSAAELLIYYRALMNSALYGSNLSSSQQKSAQADILPEAETLFTTHSIISSGVFDEATYGLGLARCRLPGKLGVMSDNSNLVEMPVIGEETRPQTVFHHSGMTSGYYSSVYLLPESTTCIVALVNSKPICDSADWIGQLIIQSLLQVPEPCDIHKCVEQSIKSKQARYDKTIAYLEHYREKGTKPKPLYEYCGRYAWAQSPFYIDVTKNEADEKLQLQFMGRGDQIYELKHYHHDTFTWLMTDDEEAKRGRFIQSVETYKIIFTTNDEQVVQGLCWPDVGGMRVKFSKTT